MVDIRYDIHLYHINIYVQVKLNDDILLRVRDLHVMVMSVRMSPRIPRGVTNNQPGSI